MWKVTKLVVVDFAMVAARRWGQGEMGSSSSMGIQSQSCKVEVCQGSAYTSMLRAHGTVLHSQNFARFYLLMCFLATIKKSE